MRRIGMAIAAYAALAGSAGVQARQPHDAATLESRNRAAMADFVDVFYRKRDVKSAFMSHVAVDYVQHDPDAVDGRDAAIAFLSPLFSAPGARFDVKRMIVDGDLAVVHVEGRPDPARPGFAVADFYRLKDGLIVEHWDVLQPIRSGTLNHHPFF